MTEDRIGNGILFLNSAADICLPKMVEPKGWFYPPQHHIFITIILGDSLLKKMLAKLSSTEQIFTDFSRFQVPVNHGEYSFAKTIIVSFVWNRWIIS